MVEKRGPLCPPAYRQRYTSTCALSSKSAIQADALFQVAASRRIIKKNFVRSLRNSCKNQNGLLSFGNRQIFLAKNLLRDAYISSVRVLPVEAFHLRQIAERILWAILRFLQESSWWNQRRALFRYLRKHCVSIIHLAEALSWLIVVNSSFLVAEYQDPPRAVK